MSDLPHIPDVQELTPVACDDKFGKLYKWELRLGDDELCFERIVQAVALSEVEPDCRERASNEVRSRVSKLLKRPLPHISPVYDAGTWSTGEYYTVRAHHASSLRCHVQHDSGYPKADLELLVDQLLCGLAALHQAGIKYGDLRLDDVQVDGGENGKPPVFWMTSVEFGGLSYWSKNKILRNAADQPAVFPPESPNKPPEPTYRADLYALGLLICQVAGGRAAIEAETITGKAEHIKSRPVWSLVTNHLLEEDPLNRPENAEAALRKYRQLRQWRTLWQGRWPTPLGLAALLGVILALSLILGAVAYAVKNRKIASLDQQQVRSEQRLANSEQRLANSEEQRQTLQQQLANAEQQIKKLEDDLRKRGIPVGSPEPPVDSPPAETNKDRLERDAAALFNEMVNGKVEPARSDDWLNARLIKRPGNEAMAIKGKISAWKGQFAGTIPFTLRVLEADSAGPRGNNWQLTIYIGGEQVGQVDFMRGDQKSDAYPQITNLEWNQGQDIRIILEDDWTVWRGGARPNLIDETYSGPYAPWKLDKDGQKLRRGDAWIRYDVVPQSGPPRNLFKPITLPTPP